MTIIRGPNIEAINDLKVVEAILKRAKAEKDLELTNRCLRRRAILEGREYDDPLLAELWTAVRALEAVRTEEAGKTVLLGRTRQAMTRKSAHELLAGWATAKTETTGFRMLVDRNMLDLSGEAIVIRHADKFEPHVVEAARNRLNEVGYIPSTLSAFEQ